MAGPEDRPEAGQAHPETGTVPLDLAAKHDGLTLFQMMIAGKLPMAPMARVLNFRLTEADHGHAIFRGTPLADFYNPLGTVHGGWAAALLDSALGCAVHTTLAAGEGYATVEYKVNLTRPISDATGEVACEGKIVHRGRRIATSEATLKDATGKLLAHGTETCMIFPLG